MERKENAKKEHDKYRKRMEKDFKELEAFAKEYVPGTSSALNKADREEL